MAKQRLDLVEDAFLRLVCVILNGQEGLQRNANTRFENELGCAGMIFKTAEEEGSVYLRQAGLHVELLEHGVHVTRGAAVFQPDKTRDRPALHGR